MTVSELKYALKDYPDDMEVLVYDGVCECYKIHDIFQDTVVTSAESHDAVIIK